MKEHEWEIIEYNISIRKFERCKVPDGYIYHNLTYAENGVTSSESMCFVPAVHKNGEPWPEEKPPYM
jgi:hypothetical protein